VQKQPVFYQKMRKLLNTAPPPKKALQTFKKAPASSIQAKKSATDFQK